MNNRLQVQLNMVGACITVAQSSDYKPAWNGKPPADFGTDMVLLATNYGAVPAKAAQADGATGGIKQITFAVENLRGPGEVGGGHVK